jgi:NADH:ubiquinone oxidoreductase subunit H
MFLVYEQKILYSFCYLLSFSFFFFFPIVGLASLTLLEQKVLDYIHIRKGPNRFGFVFSSPLVKWMFSREQYFPLVSNYLCDMTPESRNSLTREIIHC